MFGEEGIMRTNTEMRGYRACLQRGGTFLDRKGIRGRGRKLYREKGGSIWACIVYTVHREKGRWGGA